MNNTLQKENSKHTSDFDLSQITEFIYLGTNLCCGEKSHNELVHEIGFSADIDLEEERQDLPPSTEIYLWLPVKDKTAPSQEQFQAGIKLLTQMVNTQKKVYVHCKYGHGRSPTLIAGYLISKGHNLNEAIDIIKKARPEVHLEEAQLEALKKLEEKFQNEKS